MHLATLTTMPLTRLLLLPLICSLGCAGLYSRKPIESQVIRAGAPEAREVLQLDGKTTGTQNFQPYGHQPGKLRLRINGLSPTDRGILIDSTFEAQCASLAAYSEKRVDTYIRRLEKKWHEPISLAGLPALAGLIGGSIWGGIAHRKGQDITVPATLAVTGTLVMAGIFYIAANKSYLEHEIIQLKPKLVGPSTWAQCLNIPNEVMVPAVTRIAGKRVNCRAISLNNGRSQIPVAMVQTAAKSVPIWLTKILSELPHRPLNAEGVSEDNPADKNAVCSGVGMHPIEVLASKNTKGKHFSTSAIRSPKPSRSARAQDAAIDRLLFATPYTCLMPVTTVGAQQEEPVNETAEQNRGVCFGWSDTKAAASAVSNVRHLILKQILLDHVPHRIPALLRALKASRTEGFATPQRGAVSGLTFRRQLAAELTRLGVDIDSEATDAVWRSALRRQARANVLRRDTIEDYVGYLSMYSATATRELETIDKAFWRLISDRGSAKTHTALNSEYSLLRKYMELLPKGLFYKDAFNRSGNLLLRGLDTDTFLELYKGHKRWGAVYRKRQHQERREQMTAAATIRTHLKNQEFDEAEASIPSRFEDSKWGLRMSKRIAQARATAKRNAKRAQRCSVSKCRDSGDCLTEQSYSGSCGYARPCLGKCSRLFLRYQRAACYMECVHEMQDRCLNRCGCPENNCWDSSD